MSAFTDAFSAGLKRLAIEGVSPESQAEPEFSWRGCEVCGTYLGGDRYACTGRNAKSRVIVEFKACVDCVIFAANGDEPEGWRRSARE